MSLRKVRDANEARACLKAAAASGLTHRNWATAHGLDARSLNAWRLNLARGPGPRVAASPALVELVPTNPAPPSAVYRIRCGDVALEVDADFDADVLRRLLAVVASC